MLHSVTSALLLVISFFAAVRGDNGSFDFNHECLSFPQLGEVCLNFGVRTCGTLGLYFNVTLQGQLVYGAAITDITQQTVCQAHDSAATCYLCMGVASGSGSKFVLEPGYAHICPIAINRCTIAGRTFDISQPLNCLDVGVPCSSYTSCNDCTSTLTCGWCGSSGSASPQGSCLRRGLGSAPFCSSCPAAFPSFSANNSQCYNPTTSPTSSPSSDKSSSSSNQVGMFVGAVVGTLVAVVVIAVVVAYVRRSHTPKQQGYTHQLEMHDQDGPMRTEGTSVVDAESGIMRVAAAGSLNSPISESDAYHPPALKENQMPLVSHNPSDAAMPDDL